MAVKITKKPASPKKPTPIDMKPKPRIYTERIGDKEWELHEVQLDVFDDLVLWNENPRILPHLPAGQFMSDEDLEAALRLTPGYDPLRKSVEQIGQMEPVYVWRADETSKYVVLEGATRATILRELARKHKSGPNAGKFARIRAKVLPPHFGELERVILLARIHVRGTGVRAWGRYIEAKFIYDHVVEGDGKKALMSVTEMAKYMEKSVSWVMRLRDAYEFALAFITHVDGEDGEKLAVRWFSTLEEASKAQQIGPWLRDYNNKKHDQLRTDVFEMVRNGVFKEYRDARFLKAFHEDPDKWELLKSGQEGIASKLAAEVKHNSSGVKAKIAAIPSAIDRALEQEDHGGLSDEDLDMLRLAMNRIHTVVNPGVRPFRVALKEATKALSDATMADVKALTPAEIDGFNEAVEYFGALAEKYGNGGKAA